MDDALGVDIDLNPVHRQAEEHRGLDHLQGLVHHSGGIDGDLGPHAPVGMLQGLGRGDLLQELRLPGAERPPRGGEPQTPDIRPALALEGLEDGAMFAVHRQEGHAALVGQGHDQGAGGHQGLLVGQGHRQVRPNRRQGGLETHRPHHGGDHQLGSGCGGHGQGAGSPGQDFRGRVGAYQCPELDGRRLILDRDQGRLEPLDLLRQEGHVFPGRQADYAKFFRVFRRHRQGALADGTGGAQDRQTLHRIAKSSTCKERSPLPGVDHQAVPL